MNRNKFETIQELKKKYIFYDLNPESDIEYQVAQKIISTPIDCASDSDIEKLFGENYTPGTFMLSERKLKPAFLFDEPILDYQKWVFHSTKNEIKLLSKLSTMNKSIKEYGEDNLQTDLYHILHFKLKPNSELHDVIANQEYSDIFRRIITYLLMGNIRDTYDTHAEFNALGRIIAIPVVEKTINYNLYQRLIQSIASGLIGMDIKDEIAATSPLSCTGIIPLRPHKTIDDKILFIQKELEKKIKKRLVINFWNDYCQEIINSKTIINLTWFSDDYIPTIFEMKFLEEQLLYNKNLRITLIPRRSIYGNDASYSNVMDLLEEPIFQNLNHFYLQKRFFVSDKGPDMGTFNGKRISKEVAEILFNSNAVVITGARSYEMAQGVNKNTYFSGIAVCRRYTETVSGISMNSGELIFIRQDPQIHSFYDFKARVSRRKIEKDQEIPVARMTAWEFAKAIQSSRFKQILKNYKQNRIDATKQIFQLAQKNNRTFSEEILKDKLNKNFFVTKI